MCETVRSIYSKRSTESIQETTRLIANEYYEFVYKLTQTQFTLAIPAELSPTFYTSLSKPNKEEIAHKKNTNQLYSFSEL
jgi:hypothetical protein